VRNEHPKRIKTAWILDVEILVTLVIVAITLLGTAGLQLYAMRVNQGGQFRTQAVFLASDIAERMEANKQEAINGSYALGNTTAASPLSTACNTDACSSFNLAAYDLNQWGNSVAALLPQPSCRSSRPPRATRALIASLSGGLTGVRIKPPT